MLKSLGARDMRKVANRAVNRAGDKAKTQVVRALTAQTGLKRKVIVKAIGKPKRSDWDTLSYAMTTRGGDVSLKFFDPTEGDLGVAAKPFGQRTVYPGTFMRGGRWPGGRHGFIAGRHVFYRSAGARLPIAKTRSGVVIPAEMVKGRTADAFTSTIAHVLPQRIAHELKRMTKGALS
ncbi:MAG: hypothetical protein ACU0DM_13365 [Paracoccus sp. (in: a-proteobacteria)]